MDFLIAYAVIGAILFIVAEVMTAFGNAFTVSRKQPIDWFEVWNHFLWLGLLWPLGGVLLLIGLLFRGRDL